MLADMFEAIKFEACAWLYIYYILYILYNIYIKYIYIIYVLYIYYIYYIIIYYIYIYVYVYIYIFIFSSFISICCSYHMFVASSTVRNHHRCLHSVYERMFIFPFIKLSYPSSSFSTSQAFCWVSKVSNNQSRCISPSPTAPASRYVWRTPLPLWRLAPVLVPWGN